MTRPNRFFRRTLSAAALGSACLLLTACGGDSETAEAAPATDPMANVIAEAEETPMTETETRPVSNEPEVINAEGGLVVEITERGTGPLPEAGQEVAVHYKGMLTDGTVFDNSYDRGRPITFDLGEGNVIEGWDKGIALLPVGSKATLRIPSEMGYGSRGAGGVIPPNADLVFDVELVSAE